MSGNVLSSLVFRLGKYLLPAACVYWLWHGGGMHEVTAAEGEGISTLILLIGSIYAVMFAFVIYVVWGQFNDVENFMMRECTSLNELLRFADFLNPEASRIIRRAVADYVHRVVKSEWATLGERRQDKSAEQAFSELFEAVLHIAPANPSEAVMHQRLIDIARETGKHRDERVTKSLTQIPATLIHLVHTMEIGLLLLVFFCPFHNWLAGFCCFLLVAVVLFLANLVMTDTDNPFKGVYNVNPKAFLNLKP